MPPVIVASDGVAAPARHVPLDIPHLRWVDRLQVQSATRCPSPRRVAPAVPAHAGAIQVAVYVAGTQWGRREDGGEPEEDNHHQSHVHGRDRCRGWRQRGVLQSEVHLIMRARARALKHGHSIHIKNAL